MSAVAHVEPQAAGLVVYERMVNAIAACIAVDEAKDIRDKALALEAYYRQARNLDAERQAANVRLRAERRVGELLKDLARAEVPNPQGLGGRAGKIDTSSEGTQQTISEQARCKGPSPYAAALDQHGISRQTAHKFQTLAAIPDEEFDRALAGPEKPTTAAVLRHAEARRRVHDPAPTPRVSDDALWLWGRLRDFENNGYLIGNAARVLSAMTDAMRADVLRLAPLVADFLSHLEPSLDPA